MSKLRIRTARAARHSTAVAATVLAGLMAMAGPAGAAASPVRVGGSPRFPERSQLVGQVSPGTELHLTVALRPRAGLPGLASAVSTPGTAAYRHFLTAAQFARRFGASAQEISEVEATLRRAGLTVTGVSANGLAIEVLTTAAHAERAFSVSLNRVRLPGGRIAFANRQAPALPASIAPDIESIVGLDDLTLEHPAGVRRLGRAGRLSQSRASAAAVGGARAATPCTSASNLRQYGGLTADEVASAYHFDSLYGSGDTGAGQTVAMYELEPFSASDVAAYTSCYGTGGNVSAIQVDGGAGSGPGSGEAALDVEQVLGLAPAARIVVYEGPNGGPGVVDTLDAIVSDDRAKVISDSWGMCEALADPSVVGEENTLLQEAAVQGQSFFVAAGDTGSAGCLRQSTDSSLAVQDPSSQPYATGVGGTTLWTTDNCASPACFWSPGSTLIESVWNDGAPGGEASATGGGISSLWTMPAYQSQASSALGVINGESSGQPCATSGLCREVPDVAADADPQTGYVIAYDGGWGIIGGTSAAAPLWASFLALTNASAACGGHPVGFANPVLYAAAGRAYAQDFNDVTTASPETGQADNDALQINGQLFATTPGYDMTTGLGSMTGPRLTAALCALTAPAAPTAAFTVTPGSAVAGSPVTFDGRRSRDPNPGAAITAYRWAFGDGTAGSGAVPAHTYARAGTYTVTLTVTDSYGVTGAARHSVVVLPRSSIQVLTPTRAQVSTAAHTHPYSVTAKGYAPVSERLDMFADYAACAATPAGERAHHAAPVSGLVRGTFADVASWTSYARGVDHACVYLVNASTGAVLARAAGTYTVH